MHLRPAWPFYHGRTEKPFPEQEAGASRAHETPGARPTAKAEKVMHEGSLETRPSCTVSRKQSFRCSSCLCQRYTFVCRKERWTLIRHSLHFTRPGDMCGPAGNDPLRQGVADPRSPSGGGSRLRHVQFRMSRRLACIVVFSLVSATDFLIYTVDPRDWTTNQINAV